MIAINRAKRRRRPLATTLREVPPAFAAGTVGNLSVCAAEAEQREHRLLQERHKGTACGTLELLGVNRAIIIGIGSLEAFLDEREKFILVQSSVIVGVGRGKILGVNPTAQFAFIEGPVMIAIELITQLRGSTLRFGEIDRAVIIWIERFYQAL